MSCSEKCNMAADRPRSSSRYFAAFLAISALAAFFIARPLLSGLVWGSILAFLWQPVHRRIFSERSLERFGSIASAVSLIIVIICITIPMTYAMSSLARDLVGAYDSLLVYIADLRTHGLPHIEELLPEWLVPYAAPLLADKERLASAAASAIQSAASFMRSLSAGILSWTGAFIFQTFIALMAFFFMTRDGTAVANYVKDLLPFDRDDRETFLSQTGAVMRSVAYGTIMTVAVQACLGGIGWALCGLPKVFLATAGMFVFGMIPMGTAVVWLPGGIWLLASGQTASGIALLVWGGAVVSMIDSFLRPMFIGSGSSIPTLALIIGLTGGIICLGLLGVFVGPLVMAILLSILEHIKQDVQNSERP